MTAVVEYAALPCYNRITVSWQEDRMVTKVKTAKYTHIPLNQDVEAFAGYYTPEKEVRMEYKGKEVVYVTGHIVVETTCALGHSCSPANYWYATVPGYIINWQTETNKDNLPVTEIEPITDTTIQNDIRQIIFKNESVLRVDFW
jgi:hypothetical protein